MGTPTVGPAECYSGTSCAGTVLDGNSPSSPDSGLVMPTVTLPLEDYVYLAFWHWFNFGGGAFRYPSMMQSTSAGVTGLI